MVDAPRCPFTLFKYRETHLNSIFVVALSVGSKCGRQRDIGCNKSLDPRAVEHQFIKLTTKLGFMARKPGIVSEIKRFPASQRSLEGLVRWIEIITLFLSGHSQAQRSIDIAAIQFANASKFNIVVALSVVFEVRPATGYRLQ